MSSIIFWILIIVFVYFLFRRGKYIGQIDLGKVTEFNYSQSCLVNYTNLKTEKHVISMSFMSNIDVGDELEYVRYKHRGFIVNKTKKSSKHGVDMINHLSTLKDFLNMKSKNMP